MEILIASLTVFAWAFFSFWSAIPAGLVLNIAPAVVVAVVTASYAAGVGLVLLVGTPLRERIKRRMNARKPEDETPEPSRMVSMIQTAWERYGLIGLSLLAPMTVGSQMGAVIGLGFGANPVRLLIGMTVGAGLWAIGITIAVQAGLLTVSQAL